MEKEVTITVKTTQTVDGESEVLELISTGSYVWDLSGIFLKYEESEVTGLEGMQTCLQVVNDSMISIVRNGDESSALIVERNNGHMCTYDTGYGETILGIRGKDIKVNLDEDGGLIEMAYDIDVNNVLISENEVVITVKEC